MLHAPNSDNTGLTTNELICAVVNRIDAPDCLHSILALMIEASDALPINKQFRMAATLDDAATMIRERPAVRGFIDLLEAR
jgi:hypothetical protein